MTAAIREACATVHGYGDPRPSGPRGAVHLVAYRYMETAPGIYRGLGWYLDGRPVEELDLPVAWRAEVYRRLPDEEHGARWVRRWGAR